MRILIDVNLSRSWKEPLASAGHDVVHWQDVGAADADDKEIIRHAEQHGFAILTNDLDFAMLLASSGKARPSVIQLRSGSLRPNQLKQHVIAALQQSEVALAAGALLTIMPQRMRISILPLRREPKT